MKTSMNNYTRKRIFDHTDEYPYLPISLQIIPSEEDCNEGCLFPYNNLTIKRLQSTCNLSVTLM